ncbi:MULTISPECIES: DUF885 family protein [Asticcacaulis]|uniref:DUF885 domain-containing protein n=1 Tax=Asticcacaulis TaxID=76890 RepID=UPI001AE16831|nr:MULTISPECIES: DUF885 family protein [Asticcacaulis]MBP2161769.1 uncharacterized protein (DUF885 family) [Asticcacaulis solisilvae]MDR6802815.1 uncharacterized protein (DUF885 family) [Asticcacaulis sp. BE141]
MLDRRQLLISAVAVAGTASLPAAAAPTSQSDPAAAKALNEAFDAIFKERIANAPESATSLGLDKGELAGLKSKLTPATEAEDLASLARLDKSIKTLKAIPRAKLEGMDRINYDTILWRAELSKDGADRFRFGSWGGANPYVLSQLNGAYRSTPDFLANQHTIETKADADAFLARMDAFAEVIGQQTERFRADVANGVLAPDFALDKALVQMESLRAIKGADSPMTQALVKKTAAKGIAGDWAAEAARRVEGSIAAALDAQIAAVKAARGKAVHDAGVWRLKDGDAYYAFAAKVGTTTNMTPDEIHKVGLDLVKEISAEADVRLKALGYSTGTVGERMRALSEDPKYVYANTDEAKEKLIADLNVQIQAIQAKLPQWFGILPKAACEVRRVPKEIEAGAPGGYYQGPNLDGTRPGAYYINLRDTAEWPSWSLPTLTYHEAIPGHHLQIALQIEAQGLPMLRKTGGFSAYSEGWALYSELLAGEMGMYDNDPQGYVGYLQSSLFRAIRLVVDTGMHAKHWSREQAVKYFVETNGDQESSAITEIERYCVWPGQALSYMVGKLQWMKLREAMKARQGAKFDIRAFHDTGLQAGGVPLAVLEQVYKDKGLI